MIPLSIYLIKTDKPSLEFLHDLGHSGIFHFFKRQAVRLKGTVPAHHVSHFVSALASQVVCPISKHVSGTNELA